MIVEGVVGLAKAFGRAVLAEGVETIAHGELLLALGCEMGQGYGIARAMPANAVAAWVKQWQPERSWLIWNEPIHDEDSRDLVRANIKHRHWIRDIQNYVTGASEIAPPLVAGDCPLGLWINSSGYAKYGQNPAFSDLKLAHGRIHALAKQLIDCRCSGDHKEAMEGLSALNTLSDTLLEKVAEFGVSSRN